MLLSHFSSIQAKPGSSFSAKSTYGFAGKLHTAVQQNFHGLGTFKNNPAVVDALKSQVLKNQHLIRTGGLSKYQVQKMITNIHHEAMTKGEHLGAAEKEALHNIGHHFIKQEVQRSSPLVRQETRGITSLSNTQHISSVKQIGDQTRLSSSDQAIPHAAGGISNIIKNKDLNPTTPTYKPMRPPTINLST